MTFKDGSKGAERGYAPSPKRPEMAKMSIFIYITGKESNFFYKKSSLYYLLFISKGDPIIFQKLGTSLKLGPAQSLSGSAIDDLPTCLEIFTKIAVHPKPK